MPRDLLSDFTTKGSTSRSITSFYIYRSTAVVVSVLSGNRTIIAFWARSSIAEYSNHVLDRGAEWNDCRRIRDERVEILNLLRQSTSELNKKERKIGITMLKKLWTIQDERVGINRSS